MFIKQMVLVMQIIVNYFGDRRERKKMMRIKMGHQNHGGIVIELIKQLSIMTLKMIGVSRILY